jgi:N-hydroxyarylamine O-acetyltransferase
MDNMTLAQAYLADLNIINETLDINFINELQRKHIAQYSFNSLSVVLGQDLPLDVESLFNKIVQRRRGGYCFEHNKLVLNVLATLNFDVRLLLAKVVYNRDSEVARTHRITLLTYAGENYIVDAGFGPLGAYMPVKIELGLVQEQGGEQYRIIKNEQSLYHHHENSTDEYCYQVLKDGEFFTLYVFDLHHYTESDCLVSHFYSHKHPNAAFVNNLVISRKLPNEIKSLRNGEYHHIEGGETHTTQITNVKQLHQLLTEVYLLDIDIAISEFLFHKFVTEKAAT